MAHTKNQARKKKRISKHVLTSNERRLKEEATEATTLPIGGEGITMSQRSQQNASTKKKNTNPSNKKHEKDPLEGHTYLSSWKNRYLGTDIWKFNKNTQSWLLRHMYDGDKVKKETFSLLIEYIMKTPHVGFKARILNDAQNKALRYIEWEKKEQNNAQHEQTTTNKPSNIASNEKDPKAIDTNKKEELTDVRQWEGLNAHDKRKEYKRARKLIEALSAKDDS